MLKQFSLSSHIAPLAALLLAGAMALPQNLQAQSNSTAQPEAAKNPSTDPAKKPITVASTTVVVHAETDSGYLVDLPSVGSLDSQPLSQLPLSVLAVTRSLLDDQAARQLQDVIKNDASIGEDYAPVGYYGTYEIRGFPIDLATGLQLNGMTIAGEQELMLENKERVEMLKGIAATESGVASAGGLINFVTKRPALITAFDLATDHRGTAFGAVDLGHLFGAAKQIGTRFNLAGERLESYITGADGWRAAGAAAADWHITPRAIWKNDFEYQHKVQRSECGYQLLGGTELPQMSRISPSTMLGEQSWQKPNTFDTVNAISRLDVDLPANWHALAEAAYSHSLIDDNVIYPYGTPFDADGNALCSGSPNALSYYFCSDGSFAVYDYRNPGERRIDASALALLNGRLHWGATEHNLSVGGSLFRRSVEQPKHSVNEYLGAENIYQPITAYQPTTVKAAAPMLYQDDHQPSLLVQDRLRLPLRIQIVAGGRLDSLRDHNYKGVNLDGTSPVKTSRLLWLPQYAVSANPVQSVTLYANYGEMLSLGPQAPWWTDNGSAYLAPYFTRQLEGGIKYSPTQRLLLAASLFRMKAPFFYPRPINSADSFCTSNWNSGGDVVSGDLCFEASGSELHSGAELNANGKLAPWLRLTASAAFLRATSRNTGTAAYDNKQVLNVPRSHAAFFADLHLPRVKSLSLMPGWSYTSRKDATRDDSVLVAGYNLFNLGLRYQPGGEHSPLAVRIYADNIADKRYWKDTGANYGDTFLHLGAPTTVRLSAHYTF